MYHKRRRRRRASSTKKSSLSKKKGVSETRNSNADAVQADQMIMIQSPAAITVTASHNHENESNANEVTAEALTMTMESQSLTQSAGVTVPVSVLSPASSSSDKDNVISSTTSSSGLAPSGNEAAGMGAGAGAMNVNTTNTMPGQQNQIKAVGARKRKSTPMLKIESKTRISSSNGMMTPLSNNEDYDEDEDEDEDDEDEDEDELEREIGGRVVRRNRNGMIQSILSELKTAKSGIQGNNANFASTNAGQTGLASPSKEVLAIARAQAQEAAAAEDEDKDVEIEGNDRADCETTKSGAQAHNNKIEDVQAQVESGARLLRARSAFDGRAALLGQRSSDPCASASASSLSIVHSQAPTQSQSARRGRKPKQISSTTKLCNVNAKSQPSQSQRPSNRVLGRRSHSQRRGANEDLDEDDDGDDSYSDDDEQEQEDDLHNNNVAALSTGHGHGQGRGQGHGHGDGAGPEIGEQSCSLCAYTCPDKSTMLRHMRKHSGERPFQCRLCSFGFTTKANCERHLKNRHGQVDRDQVRSLIECHLVTSSMDGSGGSGGSSNDEASGHSPHLRQSQSQSQKHHRQQQQYGQGDYTATAIAPASPSTAEKSGAFSVKHMLSNAHAGKSQLNNNATASSDLFTSAGIVGSDTRSGPNSLFLPPAVFANEYLQAAAAATAKSPYMLNSLHPMFLGGAGGVLPAAAAAAMDFHGLTIANAHSAGSPPAAAATAAAGNANAHANTKRNIFLESMARGHPLFGGGAAVGGGGGAFEQLKTAAAVSANQQQSALSLVTNHGGGGAENNGPLDLSMDAMDLSVKRERGGGGGGSSAQFSTTPNANSLLKPKALYPSDNVSTGLITSPYVSKREPIVHPQLPLNFSAHGGSGPVPADLNAGVPFPLFPFAAAGNPHMSLSGGGSGFPFGLRASSEMDKFIGMSLAAGGGGPTPSKNHSIPFLAASSSTSTLGALATSTSTNNFAGSSMEIVADRDRNGNGDHPSGSDLSGRRRASLSSSNSNSVSVSVPRPASYKSSSASPNPAVSSSRHGHGGHKRAEKRRGAGGEYQKPKQRRYRTERPFSCPHCPAKFTLRSNMERHGKHQHPSVWQRSPSNRVINRQKNLANQHGGTGPSPLLSSPTLVPTNKYSTMNGFEYGHGHSAAKLLAGAAAVKHGKLGSGAGGAGLDANAVNVRAVIAQQLKRKMSGTNLRMQQHLDAEADADGAASGSGSGSGSDEDVDMEDEHDADVKGGNGNEAGSIGGAGTPDLASVSQLLNRAKSSNFAQYFAQGAGVVSGAEGAVGEHEGNNSNGNRGGSGSTGGGGGSEMESEDNRSRSSSDEQEHDDDGEIDGDEGPDGEQDGEEDDEENEDEPERERERKRYKLANGEKKKSAYSSAPHKISCPHCTRRFPWTSSLRRHLLTHTGQKPYQCSKCPLLFTTKSNCDRHLVRKHNAKRERERERELLANGGGVGSRTEPVVIRAAAAGKRGRRKGKRNATTTATRISAAEARADLALDDHDVDDADADSEAAGVQVQVETSGASTPVTTPRPGRPPKNKSQPANEFFSITPKNASAAAAALNSMNTSPSLNGCATASASMSSPGEDVAFRCHLCDASAVERDILLAHMEEDHKETFHLLLAKGALVSSPPSPPTDTSESEVTPPGNLAAALASTSTPTGDQKDVTNRKVMCVFCVRRFWSVEDLRRHIRSHSGERPFSCPYCSRRFTLKHSMLRHIKKHENSAAVSASLAGLNNNNELTVTPIMPSSTVGVGKRTRIGSKHTTATLSHTHASTISTTPLSQANFDSGPAKSDLIGKLLGINDESLVEELLSKSDAKGAAELLGLGVTSTSAAMVSSSTN